VETSPKGESNFFHPSRVPPFGSFLRPQKTRHLVKADPEKLPIHGKEDSPPKGHDSFPTAVLKPAFVPFNIPSPQSKIVVRLFPGTFLPAVSQTTFLRINTCSPSFRLPGGLPYFSAHRSFRHQFMIPPWRRLPLLSSSARLQYFSWAPAYPKTPSASRTPRRDTHVRTKSTAMHGETRNPCPFLGFKPGDAFFFPGTGML